MTRRCDLVLAALLAVWLSLAGTAWAGPFGFSLEAAAGAWFTNVGGDVADGGEKVDLDSTLDLESQTGISAWARFEHPVPFLPDLKLEFFHVAPSGEADLTASFKFGDKVFPVGAVLDTDLNLNMADLTLYWHVPLVQTVSASIFDITFGLTGRLISGDISLKTEPFGLSEIKAKDDFLALLPMGHLGVRVWPVKWLAFEGGAEGMGWDGQYWWDFYGAVHLSPWTENFFFGVGYRHTGVDVDDLVGFDLDVKASGVFVEVGFRI